MSAAQWMIYGAYGYTGTLVAREALRRGHRPILAGRTREKLAPLAETLGLDWVAIDLRDTSALAAALEDVTLVFHAAGPFVHTSAAMMRACLASTTHYLDSSGEISVLEHTLSQDAAARERGVALISGVGFDVVPSDCLARSLAVKLSDATLLEVGIAVATRPSRGTLKTALERLRQGGRVRRNRVLVRVPLGRGARCIRFPDGERIGLPIPWGDLVTAYRTTRIPNITAYLAYAPADARWAAAVAPLAHRALSIGAVRRLALWWVERRVHDPGEQARAQGRSYVWVRTSNSQGMAAEAWLETPDPYAFTASAGVRAVEKVLELGPVGALTPALAFGEDFVFEVESTHRYDALPR
jgi:short subunit dehydrogenase-like uncharacterized protein